MLKKFLSRFLPVPARTTYRHYEEIIQRLTAIENKVGNRVENKVGKSSIYDYHKSLKPYQYRRALEDWYKSRTGQKLDLDNPQTFNEKIQWLKLYDSTPLKTKLTDKYEVREWIKEKIGEQYLVPLLGVYNSFDDIDFDALPDKFVLKCTHGSTWNLIVKDKNSIDYKKTRSNFEEWMSTDYSFKGLELHYKDMIPRIIAEQFIDGIDDLKDYKFLCFDGEVKYIWVDSTRYINHCRDLFDLEWTHLPVTINSKYLNANTVPERPEALEKMIELAHILSQNFPFVRVDLYNVNEKIYFGEMTFTTGNGIEKIIPDEFALHLGDLINLPDEKNNKILYNGE